MSTSVLIYSCDKYSDVWEPFFTLFFRYWECPYRVYISSETKKCRVPGVTTLNVNGEWSDLIRQALEQIDTEYVIGMCEDFFMRRRVDEQIIRNCVSEMDANPNIACFNFEKEYDWVLPSNYAGFGRKPDNGAYRLSCQPTLWRRETLIKLLPENMNAWEWELSSRSAPNEYEYYIWTGPEDSLVFEYGYHNNQWVGLQKGKWVARDVVPLFQKEHIDVDFSIRGFV